MGECNNPCMYCEYYYYGDRTCRHDTALVEIDYVDGNDKYKTCRIHRRDYKSDNEEELKKRCGTIGKHFKRNTKDD